MTEDVLLSRFISAIREEDPERADFNNWALRHRKDMLFAISVGVRADETTGDILLKAGLKFPETYISRSLRQYLLDNYKAYEDELTGILNDIVVSALSSYTEECQEGEP